MDVPEMPGDLIGKGKRLWEEALADGTPDAGDMIARALLAERMKERERCSQLCDAIADREDALAIVKPAVDAPFYRHGEKIAKEIAQAIRS